MKTQALTSNHRKIAMLASALLIAAAACATNTAHALVLGVTEGVTYQATDNQIEAKFTPIADALSKALKQPVTIKVLSSYKDARAALAAQQVDIAFVHPTHVALQAVQTGNYKAFAWTEGYTDYRVNLLCKDAPAISNWAEIAGKTVATPDSDSITAVITRAMLREHGLKDGQVKVVTSRYQDAMGFYVDNKFAAYAATGSKAVVSTFQQGGGKTCAESRAVPIKQWLESTKLDQVTAVLVRDTLLNLGRDDAGKKAMTASGYTGFVAPSDETEKVLAAWLGVAPK